MKEFSPLGDGISSVQLIDFMGNDKSITRAARVSFAKDSADLEAPFDAKDRKLLKFLLSNEHTSPFRHNSLTLRITAPLFVARQLHKHQIGCCLSGNTRISVINSEGEATRQNSRTIEEIYENWHNGIKCGSSKISSERMLESISMLESGSSYHDIFKTTGVVKDSIEHYLEGKRSGYSAKRSARYRENLKVRCLDEQTGLFFSTSVKDVFYQGKKDVFRVTLKNGKYLDCTKDHKVLTTEGWFTLENAIGLIKTGSTYAMSRQCELLTNGVVLHQDKNWLREQRNQKKSVSEMAESANVSYHTIRKWLKVHGLSFAREENFYQKGMKPWNKNVFGYKNNYVPSEEARRKISERSSGEKSHFWKGGVTTERANIGRWTTGQAAKLHAKYSYTCQKCGERKQELHCHHILPVWASPEKARDFENLITICGDCHREIHKSKENEMGFALSIDPENTIVGPKPKSKGRKLRADSSLVEKIEYLGIQKTYDIEVEGPNHNFVANGIVVHNSINEESGRYVEVKEEFFIPREFRLQSKSNRQASVIDSESRIEQEKALGLYKTAMQDSYKTYQSLLELGVAREQARGVLPVSQYTSWYMTASLQALLHLVKLRDHPDAQFETALYARAVKEILKELFPVALEVWEEVSHSSH